MVVQNNPYLDELTKIRKALEDIEFILEYKYVPQTINHRRFRNADGQIVRECEYIEEPLKHLRDQLQALRHPEGNQNHENL